MFIIWAMEPPQETCSWKGGLLEATESPARLANKWGSAAWKCLLKAPKASSRASLNGTLPGFPFPPVLLYQVISPQSPPVAVSSALFYSMWPREGAQTLPNVKALTVTQCDTDPAQRTPLLRQAGRALISLTRSPSSPSLTQGTETTNGKRFCRCFKSNPMGLLLNQRIKPCPGGHWGTLLPPEWTKPANLPVLPCVT